MDHTKVKNLLIRHEGLRLKVYDDANGSPIVPGYTLIGNPTVGIGRALNTNGISSIEANVLLDNDIERVLLECGVAFQWFANLCDTRQSVVASMCFNLGMGRLHGFTKMLAAIERKDFEEAANQMLMSAWAGQVGARAVELALMMREGDTVH